MGRRTLARGIAVAAVVCATAGCGHRGPEKRVIVLGFDGMDFRITRDLMARGRMPNFVRLARTGAFAPLKTTIPPQSPVAWSSFITGTDPGEHGIYDFVHRDPATMTPYLSTTKTEPAARTLSIGSWRLPLTPARVELLRHGQPFWDVLEQHGVKTTIVHMPANFPPSGSASRELSGMGTPDMLGTYGTFTYLSSVSGAHAARALAGGRVQAVTVDGGIVRSELVGPDNPYREPERRVSVPLTAYIDREGRAAKIVVGDQERLLLAGEWSDWVPVDFRLTPIQTLRGMCRFYLKRATPDFELYVSPLNFDPEKTAMPISTPASFAEELAEGGRYYTQGIAEDTNALNGGVLARSEFLQQARIVRDETERLYTQALDGFREGLLFFHFGNLDQVSHMLWRPRDPGHPRYEPETDSAYAEVVEELYVAFDGLVGQTLERMDERTTLIVMSDHGFASWRRSFHLNSWLRDHGYLAVNHAARSGDGLFGDIDWARTRAYGLGLNGLYINVRGRERWGIVAGEDRAGLAAEIARGLLDTIDPQTGEPAVRKAVPRERAYRSSAYLDIAPDLIVGYAEGTRCSNESALGGVPAEVFADNTGEWSGDHCMDWDAVPGMLLTSRPLKGPVESIEHLAAGILAEYGIDRFPSRQQPDAKQ